MIWDQFDPLQNTTMDFKCDVNNSLPMVKADTFLGYKVRYAQSNASDLERIGLIRLNSVPLSV